MTNNYNFQGNFFSNLMKLNKILVSDIFFNKKKFTFCNERRQPFHVISNVFFFQKFENYLFIVHRSIVTMKETNEYYVCVWFGLVDVLGLYRTENKKKSNSTEFKNGNTKKKKNPLNVSFHFLNSFRFIFFALPSIILNVFNGFQFRNSIPFVLLSSFCLTLSFLFEKICFSNH